ncbi:MAG: apolipoprotein N-acyltransferase [Candidatus Omnitrophica bacterium]|nr:apolipoprotein N-acyltransferase [Candidatus Omnitrophota bacterium]
MKKKTVLNTALAMGSGVLGILAFPPFEITLTGWICLVPLFIIAKNTDRKNIFWYSYLSGIVFFGGVLSWLTNVSVPGMIMLVMFLALFYGFFGLVVRYIMTRSMDLFLVPLIWVIFEYLRGNIFSGFPWALLGHTQYKDINIIQIADLTGAYGVSFLIVCFNVAIFSLLTRDKRRVLYTGITVFLIAISVVYGGYKIKNFPLKPGGEMGVVQGNIAQEDKWDEAHAEHIIDKYVKISEEAVQNKPDLLIWPETSYPYLIGEERTVPEEISNIVNKYGVPVLSGVVCSANGSYYNSAVLFDGKDKIENVYCKMHLVPFGEYIPFSEYLAFIRGVVDKPIGNFDKGKEYTFFPMRSETSAIGPEGARMKWIDFYKIGVLICFEDVFPYIAREYTKKNADVLINITNDAWFGETAASRQHLQSSVFRAVENRIPVVRAANTGISCFIDPIGNVTSKISSEGKDIFVSGYLIDSIKTYPMKSHYTLYGDMFVLFCVFAFLAVIVVEKILLFRSEKKNPEKM